MLKKKIIITVIQVIIAIMILAFFLHFNINKTRYLIQHARTPYLFMAYILLVIQLIFASYRWLILLNLAGFFPPKWQCIGSFAAGSFINTTLPGGFGGDIVRSWVTSRNGVPPQIATSTVFSDRILALIGYVLLTTSILLINYIWKITALYSLNTITLSFSIIILVCFIGLVAIAPISERFNIHFPMLPLFVNLSRTIRMIFQHTSQLVTFSAVNFLVHITQITAVILVALSLHVSLSLPMAYIGIPIALLLSALPITPGGWGIRESMMVFTLAQFQVGTEKALSISILFGICTILSGVPLAIWWFVYKLRLKKYDKEVSLIL